MKIGIYVCSNGYGHFHRMLQVCTHLPFCEIDIHCERYQYNRFKPTQDNLNFIFFKNIKRLFNAFQYFRINF